MNTVTCQVYLAALKRRIARAFGKPADPYLPLPEGVSLSPSLGVAAAYMSVARKLGFDKAGAMDGAAWQQAAREKLIDLSGYQVQRAPATVTTQRDPVAVGPDLLKTSFYLRIRDAVDLPVHLIHRRDLTGPAPVFLHLAGSTSGVHLAWGDVRVPIDHQRLAVGADMARQAAARGYLAVAIEQAGYGERGERCLPKRSSDRTIDLANHLLLLGRSLMGDGASDVSSAIDWLLTEACPIQIDPARLFLFGHSAGGTLAQYAAALDPRIAGTLASGSVGALRDTIGARGAGGGDGIVPGFLNWFDTEDLIALIAPRAFVGLSGTRDHIFPAAGVEALVDAVRPFYATLGASDRVAAWAVDGPHQYHLAATWQAWERHIDPPGK